MVDSLSGRKAAETSPTPERAGTTGLATDDSPGPEEVEPAADSVEPATEMTAVPERVAEPPTAARRESPARSDVIPWTTTSPRAKTARKGLGWKWRLIAAGLFIGLLAAASWMIFSPDQPSVEGLKTASLAGESRDPADARNRAGSLVFPFERGDRIEESVKDDAAAPAEATAEPETPAETPEPPTESTKPAPTATPPTSRPAESKPRAAKSKPAVTETPSRAPVETTKKAAVAPPKAPPERPAAKADVDPPSPKPTEPSPRPAPKPASRPPDTTSKTPVARTPVPPPPAPTAKPEPDPIEPDPGPQVAAGPTGPAPTEAELTPPRLVTRQEPVYPSRARKRGEGGVVELKVLVSEQGRVVRVVVEAGLPGSELEARAIDAALRSTYEPATEAGKSVRAWVTERFVFEP
jgi:protein TonB